MQAIDIEYPLQKLKENTIACNQIFNNFRNSVYECKSNKDLKFWNVCVFRILQTPSSLWN